MSRPYHWFQGASVEELVKRLTAADPATARLEVHQLGPHMTFRVVPAGDVQAMHHGDEHINDSHICPPQCP